MIQVVKIGGNVIDDAAALERFLTKFAALEGPKMLIHGGGKLATRLSAQLGIETQMIDGRRVTDRATLDVANPLSQYYRSARFSKVLENVNKNAKLFEVKQPDGRLRIIVRNVDSIARAHEILKML